MAERPSHVDVGPYRYAVRWDQDALNAHSIEAGHGCDGLQNGGRLEIVISPKGHSDYQRRILIHEVLHALFGLAGGMPKRASEDDAIDVIESAVLDLLRRNPHLVAWLQERENA